MFSTAQATEQSWVELSDGARLAYLEGGKGTPVVLVHGGLQDYRFWQLHVPVWAKTYRVIAHSRRNHFPNETSREGAPDNAADLHADDLASLVKALNLQRVHVVAHSSGAHAALFFASKYPELVRSLVVHEPPAVGLLAAKPEGAAVLKELGARQAPSREAFRSGDLAAGVRLFVDAIGGPGTYQRRPEAERAMNADNAISHAADAISSRPRVAFTCELAQRISAPVLLTTSEKNIPFFHQIADELVPCLSNVQRRRISAASHTAPTDNPTEYSAAIVGFLGAQRE